MVDNPFFDLKSLILFSSAILNFGVFCYLIINKIRLNNSAKFYLVLSSLSVSLWMFTSWIMHFSNDIQVTTFCARFSFGIIFWLIINLILFTQNYLLPQKSSVLIISLVVLIFSSVLLSDLVVLKGNPSTFYSCEYSTFGLLMPIFLMVTGFLFVLLSASFLKIIQKSNGIKREKLIFLAFLLIPTLLIVLIFNFVLPVNNIDSLSFVGQLTSFVFAISISLNILHEKTFSFKFLFVNSIVTIAYGLVIALLFFIASKLAIVLSNDTFGEIIDIKFIAFIFLIASLTGQFLGPLMSNIKKITYKIYGLSSQDLDETVKWLIKKTNNEINIEKYLPELLQKLQLQMATPGIYIYLFAENKLFKTSESFSLNDIPQNNKGKYTNLDWDENQKYALIYQLCIGVESLGYLLFEHKSNNGFYSLEEIYKINNLQQVLTMAINRYNSLGKEKAFNKILSEKIKTAIKKLEVKNIKLAETLRFERDMFDILGHELRTPLSIARNAIYINESLLKEPDKNLLKIQEYNSTALRNSEKEIELLNTLLSATKIDNNKLELKTTT